MAEHVEVPTGTKLGVIHATDKGPLLSTGTCPSLGIPQVPEPEIMKSRIIGTTGRARDRGTGYVGGTEYRAEVVFGCHLSQVVGTG
jgi:hypothetical protein